MTLPQQRTTTPGAAAYQDLLHELTKAVAELQTLRQQAVESLATTVQDILRSSSRDAQWIEHTLDQLLDHACLPEGLALFKSLCRHYWMQDPQATASYINAYRALWDADDNNDTQAKP